MFTEEDLTPELWFEFIKSLSNYPEKVGEYLEYKSPELDQRLLSSARIAFAVKDKTFMNYLDSLRNGQG